MSYGGFSKCKVMLEALLIERDVAGAVISTKRENYVWGFDAAG